MKTNSTICWCLEEEKSFKREIFFDLLSRNLVGRTNMSKNENLNRSLWKEEKTTMKETKQTTFICYYCWLTLTKSIFSWNQFFTKISILYLERNREQQTNTNIHEVTSWRLVWTKNDDDFEDLIDVKDHAKKEDKCSKLAVYDSIWKFIQKKPNFSHYSTRISGIILNFLNSTAIATLLLLLLQLT